MPKMNNKSALLFVLLSGLAGCATSTNQDTVASAEPTKTTKPPIQFKAIFSSSCPVSNAKPESLAAGVAIGVLADVAGKLVGSTVDAIGSYLTDTQAATFTDATRLEGFAVADQGKLEYNVGEGCLIVFAARDFDPNLKEAQVKAIEPFPKSGAVTDETIRINLHKVTNVSGPILFYMEATLHFNSPENQSAFTFVPRTWYYPEFISTSSWRFAPERDVLFRVEYSTPGTSSTFGVLELQWTNILPTNISQDSVISKKLPWSPLPSDLTHEANAVTVNRKVPIHPTNVKVLLTETAKPYTLVQYVGEALKSQKNTIVSSSQDMVNQAFSREARANARAAAASNIESKYASYAAAYDAADAAQKAYSASTGLAAQKALASARTAYAKLDAAETLLRIAYSNADIGTFQPLTPLPRLP
jgi:hypothetical protein